jgi:hypothetical protein
MGRTQGVKASNNPTNQKPININNQLRVIMMFANICFICRAEYFGIIEVIEDNAPAFFGASCSDAIFFEIESN